MVRAPAKRALSAEAIADLPEPDRLEGLPHPRETRRLFGHDRAEAQLLTALASGRLHHAWLLTGPKGIGKATLAWRFAAAALAYRPGGLMDLPPTSLDTDPGSELAHRIAARAEPGLRAVTRSWNTEKSDPKDWRLRDQIVVEDVRALRDFFGLSSTEGGRRVVIIDAADDMNISAANAILKLMEEPPAGALLLLVSHRPGALLPTIRSRCRVLRLDPLAPGDLAQAMEQALGAPPEDPEALAELAGGSVGGALALAESGGLALYGELVTLLFDLPRLDRPRLLRFAEGLAARGQEARLSLATDLFEILLARLARAAATGQPLPEAAPGESRLIARIAADPASAPLWAALSGELPARLRKGRAVNLDPAGLVADMFLRLEQAARF